MKRLLIEGWRGIAHSYAIVNQWQLMALGRRRDVDFRVRDLPYYQAHWRTVGGLFNPEVEDRLAHLPEAESGFTPDATYRIGFPYDLSASGTGLTAVFGTAEYRVVPPSYLGRVSDIGALARNESFRVITPSRWSAMGFERLGLGPERIAIVPHGVDLALFRPDDATRTAIRKKLGLSGFVIMNMGAMTQNKGVDLLLKAFATLAESRPDLRLLLKGADDLYASRQLLRGSADGLSAHQQALVSERLVYSGASLSMREVAALYLAADLYVSPYRAEGFNMPVLEAAACGVPVICTAGGSTDDFMPDGIARKIRARIGACAVENLKGEFLAPDFDHLVDLIRLAIDDESWRASCREAGPRHVANGYDWDQVVGRLVCELFRA